MSHKKVDIQTGLAVNDKVDMRGGQCPADAYDTSDELTSLYHPVLRPEHYASGKYEVIDIIRDQLGYDGLRGFCLGNTLKYICRAGKKDPAKTKQDLEKARWYLDHWIANIITVEEK